VDNTRALVDLRRRRGAKRPRVTVQFLVWKENFRTIPEMYRLAREIGADGILFNGLSFLKPEQKMTPAETEEMMALYEQVLKIDEYRRIINIGSYEQDLTSWLTPIQQRIGAERSGLSLAAKAARFLSRSDFTLREKVDHFVKQARHRRTRRVSESFESYCLIGWHSLLIRTTGAVAPCCILQGKELGNVYRQSLRDVWHGEAYGRFRAELSRIMREKADWKADEGRDQTVDSLCGAHGGCPIATFYYQSDKPFLRSYNRVLG
jgi:MoaA/NifB/PqqE/SkfB family radical SAM enzyme